MCDRLPVVGYEGLYEVTSDGQVFGVERTVTGFRNGKLFTRIQRANKLKQLRNFDGYLFVTLCKEGHQRHIPVHRIVAEAFLPNPNSLPCVNHKDGCKQKNCVSNLEWVTCAENTRHAIENGLWSPSHFSYVYTVDDFQFNTLQDASKYIGCAVSTLSDAFRCSRTTVKGHSICRTRIHQN